MLWLVNHGKALNCLVIVLFHAEFRYFVLFFKADHVLQAVGVHVFHLSFLL